jgi:hypothetical protein
MVFLRRSEVSHYDVDHLVEDHCSSPALCYLLCVAYEIECLLVLFLMTCFYSHKYQEEISSVI